ncbi:MAG: 50S ribosomal protein L17 [Planctomycetes bacterium]|nr:50S ribosomal protein L17 [Planctomycetota bacterium]
MRHRKKGYKLGRTTSHREAMMRNLVSSLFTHERIVTTVPKAKACRAFAEKLITMAKGKDLPKEKTLHKFRTVLAHLGNDLPATRKLFRTIGPRFSDRPGGYTRILKLARHRLGDNAPLAIFELVERSPAEDLAEERAKFQEQVRAAHEANARKLQRKKRGRNFNQCDTRRRPHQLQAAQVIAED